MGMYTYLNDDPAEDTQIPEDVSSLLNEVREKTGKHWRLQKRVFNRWFSRKPIVLWELFCPSYPPEYQCVVFYSDDSFGGIRSLVPIEEISAYLIGILNGLFAAALIERAKEGE